MIASDFRTFALYQSINSLLSIEFPKLEKQIQNHLGSRHLELDVNWTHTNNGAVSSWSLSIDFDDYEWSSKIMKPHWMHIALRLEMIEDKSLRYLIKTATLPIAENNTLVLTIGNLKNSFELDENYDYENDRRYLREVHISLTDLENEKLISDELEFISIWLKTIYGSFKNGIDRVDPSDLQLLEAE